MGGTRKTSFKIRLALAWWYKPITRMGRLRLRETPPTLSSSLPTQTLYLSAAALRSPRPER